MANSSLPRLLLVCTIIATGAVGYKAYKNQSLIKEAQAMQATAQQQVQAAKTAQAKAQKELAAAQAELKTAQAAQAGPAAGDVDVEQLKKDLEAAKANIQTLEARNKELEDKAAAAPQDAEATPTPADASAGAPAAIPADADLAKKLADSETLLKEKEQLIQTLNAQLAEASAKAEKATVASAKAKDGGASEHIVSVGGGGGAVHSRPVARRGTVLSVQPDYNFVVLNMGSRQGLAVGASLVVQRGDQYIGRVRVSSVEHSTAIADVPGSLKKTPIQPGDVVMLPSI